MSNPAIINEAIKQIKRMLALASGKKERKEVVKMAITIESSVANNLGFNNITSTLRNNSSKFGLFFETLGVCCVKSQDMQAKTLYLCTLKA